MSRELPGSTDTPRLISDVTFLAQASASFLLTKVGEMGLAPCLLT